MNKLAFAVYPVIATLALAAAFSAQAQNINDPADQAAYGAMPAATSASGGATKAAPVARPPATNKLAAAFASRAAMDTDPLDHAAYGSMPAAGVSLRTRAEVRAEAIAARDAGFEATWREGGDPQYAILNRAKTMDTAHLVAAAKAKANAKAE